MSIIQPFAAGSYATGRNTANLVNLKSQLDTLTTQLTTGRAAETYGGLGTGRSESLSAHAALSALDGYDSTITTAQTRVQLASASLTELSSLTTTLRKSIDNAALNNGASASNNALLARNGLDAAIDALNQQSADQYLFGGRVSNTPPVVSTDTLLNGSTAPQKDGLKTVVQELINADIGTDVAAPNTGLGRLTLAAPVAPATNLTLSAASAATPPAFGFGLPSAPTAKGSAFTVTTAAASPPSYQIGLSGNPAAGDSLTLTLALPDNTTRTITLTAMGSSAAGSTTDFAIDPTSPANTAANLSTAIRNALGYEANTTLSASSVVRATQNFFDETGVKRVGFDASSNPVFLTAAQASAQTPPVSTVQWYQGEISSTDARGSASVRVGATQTVEVGARANEAAIKAALTSLAAAAVSNAGVSATTAQDRWNAVAQRTTAILPAAGTLETVASDFSLAASSLSNAQSQNKTTRATLQSSLDSVESVTTEEVAAKLLATQNQLQASYQVTSMLSKLSLVNYLS
ncbi:flagellin [Methylobacterium nigriterrae]|uniref:flagellin n=1 Tax=Methylobacterium nigriterrae TaxID=3127512 RepID=UPI003013AAEC